MFNVVVFLVGQDWKVRWLLGVIVIRDRFFKNINIWIALKVCVTRTDILYLQV